jgi:hypothetical protein
LHPLSPEIYTRLETNEELVVYPPVVRATKGLSDASLVSLFALI